MIDPSAFRGTRVQWPVESDSQRGFTWGTRAFRAFPFPQDLSSRGRGGSKN